ncbi:DUF2851 family protein [Candidatus Poribacteria bacterium]|nr:DUF2851 family protein [Candidatus Poribacteria bacterium]
MNENSKINKTHLQSIEHINGEFREIDEIYEPDFDKIDEAFVQKVWNDQRFINSNLSSIAGKQVRVLKPGVWNHEDGPDFMHAEIEIDGKLHVGDVEIHVKASEWYVHKHHLNSRYNRVILHTVLFDDDFNLRTRLQNGKRVPTLELLKYVDAPIGDLFDQRVESDEEKTKSCRVTGNQLDIVKLQEVFESLGTERFLEKADAIRLLRTRLNFEQILYEGIMEALGYSQNSKQFRELAQRVPFNELDNKSEHEIQALLFGVAGLLPSQMDKPLPEEEENDPLIVALETLWEASDHSSKVDRMNSTQWRFGRTRPSNFPTRRIAAMSQLLFLSKGSLMMYFLGTCEKAALVNTSKELKSIQKELLDLLMLEPTDYWSMHSNFGKGISQNVKLIGESRALDIMVNKILPLAYIWSVESESSKLQDAILKLYGEFKKVQENKHIKQVGKQIYSESQPANVIKYSARIHQGMIRLYKNYCADQLCDLCPLIEYNVVVLEES